jgi:aspartate racemase
MYKRIGILGGLTPESTVPYYMHIVHRYEELHGDHGYPEVVIYSVSFQQFEDWMEKEDWASIEEELMKGLVALYSAGVDFAVVATNTMHYLYDRLAARSPVPLLSLVEATAAEVKKAGIRKVGLIGTGLTMNKPFYRDVLARRGIETITPGPEEQKIVIQIIFDELSFGVIKEESRRKYLKVIDGLHARGAEGVILGCTEIPLLIKQEHTKIPVFDTTTIHAEAALQHALKS